MNIKYLLIIFLLCSSNLWGAYLYVDQGDHETGVTWDDTDGHSYTSSADGFPGAGTGYNTIQAAVDAASPGDTIYMRGGTYSDKQAEGDGDFSTVIIPHTKDGTSEAWYTLTSYPGEWAILDGGNTGDESGGIVSPGFNSWGQDASNLQYWKFERFEVTGYTSGIWMTGGPITFRYLYIHDNDSSGNDFNSGIMVMQPRYNTIEYCYITGNYGGVNANNGNIIFDSDQRDGTGDGTAFDANYATHHNIVRYNYLGGDSPQNFRHKNQQRFGVNSRNPEVYTYKEYGDLIHHNIALGAPIRTCQDFCQVYNNISNREIAHQSGDVPIIYNMCVYNNTVIGQGTEYAQYEAPSGVGEAGNTAYLNYYDDGDTRTVHNHMWYYNNIADSAVGGYKQTSFQFYWNMPSHDANWLWDMSDTVVERNLVRDNAYTLNSARYIVGHNYNYTGCDGQYYTTEAFNSCSATWRGVGSVLNFEQDGGTLFQGASGADQYRSVGSFDVDGESGGYTVANGGIGGAHPYLSGVTIPSYIGATDPSDDDWVAGVLSLATYTNLRDAANGSDPSWIEGSESESPSTPSITGVMTGIIR